MEILDVVPDSEANFWEREYIQNFRERGFDLTNIYDGGDVTKKTGVMGRKHAPETINKLRAARLGTKHSLETREQMSASRAGVNHPNFGKKLSASVRANIGAGVKAYYERKKFHGK